MTDPFRIEGPALLSFSGGRTSAYLLHRVLKAHGGELPRDVHVVFANTGKEFEATLRFVLACSTRWCVPVQWLEYRRRYRPAYKSANTEAITARLRSVSGREALPLPEGVSEPGYVEVSFATAARNGEPYQNFLDLSGLPNAAGRRCTTELKIRPMKRWMLAQGYTAWDMVLGIRADEPERVRRLRTSPPERWEHILPLADAGITEADVHAFWRTQSFDLDLPHDPQLGTYQGNCDLCFLKSTDAKVRIAREAPERLAWWEQQERVSESFFRPQQPYAKIRRLALAPVPAARERFDDALGDCLCHD